ncbi:putative membrane-anchored protein [Saccharopolyspora lacisalsi]|uniref:Putative membrane-anchored protein n=1 Tax=Halosaccharopolyspora lacisalsi TaxID=1000566 RepID=A0A839DVK9_9PSEU|nr:putative cytokinetic ring protein SteA [Halosaccharopolyspora lacisalsi]MBA8824276.1 putative membrane-anchored protein [Halosaccharopolyspora lacisalsi]
MRISGLLGNRQEDLPGVVGPARIQRRPGGLPEKIGPGDIAVLDQADLDRRTAEALIETEVAGVINAAPSISGRFPSLGPEILLAAGVTLVDGVGKQGLEHIRDGAVLWLHEGGVFLDERSGQREIARGTEQDADSVAEAMIEAKAGMSAQLEAFSANIVEFLSRERMLVLEDIGVPELVVPIEGRHALVLAPGYGHTEDLRRLRRYIGEQRPVLIGVDRGADTLFRAGYRPDVIVGDPGGIDTETLRGGGEVVVPASLDGHAPGLERIQDLGVGAVTFPASGNAEDLALLLADANGAELVVTIGFQATLHEFLDGGRSGSNPSTFLTRLKLGSKLVDGGTVASLHRGGASVGVVTFLVLAAMLAMLAALAVSGLAAPCVDVVVGTAETLIDFVGGFFA